MERLVGRLPPAVLAVVVLAAGSCREGLAGEHGPVVLLAPGARDSMNAAFDRSNEHWNELADLNTMERMLGTIRPTQREYLGCLQGEVARVFRVAGGVQVDGEGFRRRSQGADRLRE